ncbi:hypothetical protein BGW39_006155, partial [Mortierella sp. 14UC]
MAALSQNPRNIHAPKMPSSPHEGVTANSLPHFLSAQGHPELAIGKTQDPSQPKQSPKLGHAASQKEDIPHIPHEAAANKIAFADLLNPLGHLIAGTAPSDNKTLSASSEKSSKLGFRKRLSVVFKGDRKAKDGVVNSLPVQAPARSGHYDNSSVPDIEVFALAVAPTTSPRPVNVATAAVTAPIIQVQTGAAAPSSIRQDIFPKNMAPATLTTPLPRPHARIEQTTQLVYCCSLLAMSEPTTPASDIGELQGAPLDDAQQQWLQLIDPIEKHHLRWLVEKLVRVFVEDNFKGPIAVAEIVLLGPILDCETYRSLLSCFISQFEQAKLLDTTLLQGLVQLIECASAGYLIDDDLVRMVTVLFKELSVTHNSTNDHVLILVLALGRALDVLVAGKVKDLNRDRDHQPMLQLLCSLKDSDDTYLKYQAAYAYQALQYAPDVETPLQVLLRYSKMALTGALAVTNIFKLGSEGLLEGIKGVQELATGVVEVVKAGIEGVQPLREGAGTALRTAEDRFDIVKKRSWYLALQGTALFIRQGRLSDFKQVVSQAPCRHDINFQWGIC